MPRDMQKRAFLGTDKGVVPENGRWHLRHTYCAMSPPLLFCGNWSPRPEKKYSAFLVKPIGDTRCKTRLKRRYRIRHILPLTCIADVSFSEDVPLSDQECLEPLVIADSNELLTCVLTGTDAELSVFLCSDEYISRLNEEWRGIASPTDVISFPQDHEGFLGDIVISIPRARAQALERNYNLRSELRVLLVHGLLHLLGYDHELNEGESRRMAGEERRILKLLGWAGLGLILSQDTAETSKLDDNQ